MSEEDGNDNPDSKEMSMVLVNYIPEGLVSTEMEEKIDEAVLAIIESDQRFSTNIDLETVDAIRDWIRSEVVIRISFKNYLDGGGTSRDERMFRAAMTRKNALRDEIFGKFKGRSGKKDEISKANEILVDYGIVEPVKDVDILESK